MDSLIGYLKGRGPDVDLPLDAASASRPEDEPALSMCSVNGCRVVFGLERDPQRKCWCAHCGRVLCVRHAAFRSRYRCGSLCRTCSLLPPQPFGASRDLFGSFVRFREEHLEHVDRMRDEGRELYDVVARLSQAMLRKESKFLDRFKPSDVERECARAWVDSDSVTRCGNCGSKFSLLLPKHHCRLCGNVFCDRCSSCRVELLGRDLDADEDDPPCVRACTSCDSLFRSTMAHNELVDRQRLAFDLPIVGLHRDFQRQRDLVDDKLARYRAAVNAVVRDVATASSSTASLAQMPPELDALPVEISACFDRMTDLLTAIADEKLYTAHPASQAYRRNVIGAFRITTQEQYSELKRAERKLKEARASIPATTRTTAAPRQAEAMGSTTSSVMVQQRQQNQQQNQSNYQQRQRQQQDEQDAALVSPLSPPLARRVAESPVSPARPQRALLSAYPSAKYATRLYSSAVPATRSLLLAERLPRVSATASLPLALSAPPLPHVGGSARHGSIATGHSATAERRTVSDSSSSDAISKRTSPLPTALTAQQQRQQLQRLEQLQRLQAYNSKSIAAPQPLSPAAPSAGVVSPRMLEQYERMTALQNAQMLIQERGGSSPRAGPAVALTSPQHQYQPTQAVRSPVVSSVLTDAAAAAPIKQASGTAVLPPTPLTALADPARDVAVADAKAAIKALSSNALVLRRLVDECRAVQQQDSNGKVAVLASVIRMLERAAVCVSSDLKLCVAQSPSADWKKISTHIDQYLAEWTQHKAPLLPSQDPDASRLLVQVRKLVVQGQAQLLKQSADAPLQLSHSALADVLQTLDQCHTAA